MSEEEKSVHVSAVSVKLPPFWPADPSLWFAQVEAQIQARGISVERTRFDYVVASLSPEVATEVRDLILNPPTSRPYTELCTELIQRTAVSQRRQLQKLLSGEELGDQTPSRLLRRMERLLGDDTEQTNGPLFRELFLQPTSECSYGFGLTGTDLFLERVG